MATQITTIKNLALQEWNFFGNQEISKDGDFLKRGKVETDDGFWDRVGVYWKEGTNTNLNGLNTDEPWSATFISYIMRNAGLGNQFYYSIAHRDYINRAIIAKQNQDTTKLFWGHKISQYTPKIGDLVCYARQNDLSYENRPEGYASHSDIVIDIVGKELLVIGGNVKDSVTLKHLKLDNNGILVDNQFRWFTILENRIQDNIIAFNYNKQVLKKALEITGDFETSGNPFSGITGNFDQMGISCGVLQWNIGKSSLQPLVLQVGKTTVEKYMPMYGDELWDACNKPKSEGLIIVRAWQKNNVLRSVIKNELANLFGSAEMIEVQLQFANNTGTRAFELATRWAKEMDNRASTLQEFCWFFDLLVLNGGLKELWINDVKNFIQTNGQEQSVKIIFDWVLTYPKYVTDEGETIESYGRGDAFKNVEIWKTIITNQNINLFVLGYLRAKLSRKQFQLVVTNRRGTIALGKGYVNAELENISF
jgi:Uncharacterized protein conserved in bacteria (DUF2272)